MTVHIVPMTDAEVARMGAPADSCYASVGFHP